MSTAALTRDLIVTQTRALKLPGVARVFESLARQARDGHWPGCFSTDTSGLLDAP